MIQKRKIKKQYAKAARAAQTSVKSVAKGTASAEKIRRFLKRIAGPHKKILALIFAILFVLSFLVSLLQHAERRVPVYPYFMKGGIPLKLEKTDAEIEKMKAKISVY